MYKKIGVFILLLVYGLIIVSGQGLDREAFENDSVVKGVQDIQEFAEERKWEYLSEQWKETLLKNEIINRIDEIFTRLNFLFFFFLGEDYEISLTLFFVFLWWVFFAIVFGNVIGNFSTLSKGVSGIMGILLAIILSHLGALNALSVLTFKVIFFKEGLWRWASVALFIFVYFMILLFLEKIIYNIGLKMKKTREEKEAWAEKFKRKLFMKKVEGIEKGLASIGSSMK